MTVLAPLPRRLPRTNRLANVETKLAVLTWMVGANIALTIAAVVKLFH